MSLQDRDKVVEAVEGNHAEMVGILQELIRIDTVVSPGNNYPQCAQFIQGTRT